MDRFSLEPEARQRRERRLQRTLIAVALSAAAAGCGTAMTSSPSGFLSTYEGLTVGADGSSATRRVSGSVDPSQVTVEGVKWRAVGSAQITDAERLVLANRLQAELRDSLRCLPAAPQGRPVILRAAITRVEPVSPALNAASALLLFVPLDRGGAAVEIEAIDAQTGRQLAALRLGHYAPMTELKARFSKLAPAEIALKKAAVEFARLLKPA